MKQTAIAADPDLAANAPSCAREGYAFFYERIGKYFLAEDDPVRYTRRKCDKCGATGAKVADAGYCQAYRSIATPRYAPADGLAPAYGVALKIPVHETGKLKGEAKGPHTSLRSDNVFAFADATREFVACNVAPLRPTPDSMMLARGGPRNRLAIFKMLIATPPKPPFLVVEFGRNLSFDLFLSHDPSRVIYCQAPQATLYDLDVLAKIDAALAPIIAASANPADLPFQLRNFVKARLALAHNEPKAGTRLKKLIKATPALRPALNAIADIHSPEFELALDLLAATYRSA
jgi:hypothetical protein